MNDLLTIVSEIERLSKNVSSWHECAVYTRNNADTLVEQVRALSEENEKAKARLARLTDLLTPVDADTLGEGSLSMASQLIDKWKRADRAALADKGATS